MYCAICPSFFVRFPRKGTMNHDSLSQCLQQGRARVFVMLWNKRLTSMQSFFSSVRASRSPLSRLSVARLLIYSVANRMYRQLRMEALVHTILARRDGIWEQREGAKQGRLQSEHTTKKRSTRVAFVSIRASGCALPLRFQDTQTTYIRKSQT